MKETLNPINCILVWFPVYLYQISYCLLLNLRHKISNKENFAFIDLKLYNIIFLKFSDLNRDLLMTFDTSPA